MTTFYISQITVTTRISKFSVFRVGMGIFRSCLMSTNYYLFTRKKNICENNKLNFELTDVPSFGYKIHIAKISCGWFPFFQSHPGLRSFDDLERIYATGYFKLYDENCVLITWTDFYKKTSSRYSSNKNLSHIETNNSYFSRYCSKDKYGYEFTELDFR